jgi:hypothetical protein
MDSSFNADRPNDDLSTVFGTETLAERHDTRGLRKYAEFEDGYAWEVISGGRAWTPFLYLRWPPSVNVPSAVLKSLLVRIHGTREL